MRLCVSRELSERALRVSVGASAVFDRSATWGPHVLRAQVPAEVCGQSTDMVEGVRYSWS